MVDQRSHLIDDESPRNPNPPPTGNDILAMREQYYVRPPSNDESVNSNSHSLASPISPPGQLGIPLHPVRPRSDDESENNEPGIRRDRAQYEEIDALQQEIVAVLEGLDFLSRHPHPQQQHQQQLGSVRVGLPPETVAALPVVQFKKEEANDVEGGGDMHSLFGEFWGWRERCTTAMFSHIPSSLCCRIV